MKKSGGGCPIHGVFIKPSISPPHHTQMNPLAHPRGPPIELETAQLLCRPSMPLAGPRGAARLAAVKQWAGQRTLCAFPPAPAEPQDWASPVTAPEGLLTQPTEPQGKCSSSITCQEWGRVPLVPESPQSPLFPSASRTSAPWQYGSRLGRWLESWDTV